MLSTVKARKVTRNIEITNDSQLGEGKSGVISIDLQRSESNTRKEMSVINNNFGEANRLSKTSKRLMSPGSDISMQRADYEHLAFSQSRI